MRNSGSKTGVRPWRAGVAVTATAAAVVAGLATPAYAAVADLSLDNTTGPVGGGNTVVATGTGVVTGVTTPGVRFVPGAATACPANYTTTLTGALNATGTKGNDDNTVNIVVPAVVLGTTYGVCVYNGTTSTSTPTGKTTTGQAYIPAAATPTLSPYASNPATSTSPVSITATGTGPYLTGVTTVATIFTTAASCPANYSATGAITATTTKNSTGTVATITAPTTLSSGSTYNVCLYNGTTNTSSLVGSAQYSVVPSVALSPSVGPSGGLNTVIASSTTNNFLNGVTTPGAIFTRNDCLNTYKTGASGYIEATTVTKITPSRVSVKVPATVQLTGSEASAKYNLCIYSGASNNASTLVAQALAYSIAAATSLTSISPTSGPSQGGQFVTIVGTNFPTSADAVPTVTVGGSALQGVKVSSDGTTITGTTTSHAPSATNTVSVTTMAGTKTGLTYAYTYGITVIPSTAPPAPVAGTTTSDPTIDIQGAGFSNFGTSVDATTGAAATGPAVLLVDNSWFSTTAKPINAGLISECTNITVISDNELICKLDIANTIDPATGQVNTGPAVAAPVGTYSVVVYNDLAVTNASTPAATMDVTYSRVSSGSTFTVSDY